jgi:heat shock protein HslJ
VFQDKNRNLEPIMNLRLIAALFTALLSAACVPGDPTTTETEDMTPDSDLLTGTSWQVEDIDGGGVIDGSPATVQFPEPGRVAGNSSCNRYMGGYERDGQSLSFGALAGTMMACPDSLMNQERHFYEAMEQVTGWRIDPQTDLLHLVNEAGDTIIRASRLPAEDPAGN